MHKNRKNSQSQAQKHLHQTAAHLPYGSIGLLLLVFWASGATSLVYETLWARQLHLVFGTSQLAISTVLAAFMAGLALGGFSAARWADRLTRPLLVYAFLEAGIGLYAVAFPFLIQLVSPIQLAFWRSVEPSPSVFGAFQFVTVGLLLLPPTMCMGATLPLLTRFISSSSKTSGETGFQVGRLYGANTLGAVIGTALAGFVLLPQLGLSVTTWWTAAANGVLALGAAVLSYRGEPVTASQPVQTQSQETSSDSLLPLFIIAGLAGFASLLCEVAWFRLLSLMLGGSAYAFSLMLLAFLLGIGIGGWGGGWGARRSFRHGGTAQVLRRVAWLQIGVASLTWAAMHAYSELPFVSIWLGCIPAM